MILRGSVQGIAARPLYLSRLPVRHPAALPSRPAEMIIPTLEPQLLPHIAIARAQVYQHPLRFLPTLCSTMISYHSLGKWRVKRVVHHRGKFTHRSKLQFRVQWEPHYSTERCLPKYGSRGIKRAS